MITHGFLSQSVGGGGSGKEAVQSNLFSSSSKKVNSSFSFGDSVSGSGNGSGGGDGGDVNVLLGGTVITTMVLGSDGISIQSIGGGGGSKVVEILLTEASSSGGISVSGFGLRRLEVTEEMVALAAMFLS